MNVDGGRRWSGLFPASLTVFDDDGALNLDLTGEHIAWLFAQGADGVVVGGTTGEFIAMTADERRALTEVAVAAGAGRGSVFVNTGSYLTSESIMLTEHAASSGVDAALVVQPYFQRPTRDEMLAHYRAVSCAELPMLVYNIPANSAADAVSPADLGALSFEGAVQGVKSTLAIPGLVDEIRVSTRADFCILYGGIGAPIEGFASGADGWVTGLLNVALTASLPMRDAVAAGDLRSGLHHWNEVRPLRDLVRRWISRGSGDVAVYRAILEAMGRNVGSCRLPLRPMDRESKLELHRELEAISGDR